MIVASNAENFQAVIALLTLFLKKKNHVDYLVTDPNRLFGEIAYQLDRRILSHVFQGNKRFYGFTLVNIKVKITEVRSLALI